MWQCSYVATWLYGYVAMWLSFKISKFQNITNWKSGIRKVRNTQFQTHSHASTYAMLPLHPKRKSHLLLESKAITKVIKILLGLLLSCYRAGCGQAVLTPLSLRFARNGPDLIMNFWKWRQLYASKSIRTYCSSKPSAVTTIKMFVRAMFVIVNLFWMISRAS